MADGEDFSSCLVLLHSRLNRSVWLEVADLIMVAMVALHQDLKFTGAQEDHCLCCGEGFVRESSEI